MTFEGQRRARALFDAALDREPAERCAFLAAACGDDEALRVEIEALLAAHERAKADVDPDPRESGEQPGERIGHYKLRQKIGEGGFGVVWMAEQQEPVRRKVALKVLKPGMDTAQVVARFEAERQALALMDHPNIAKVFDGGATPAGRPYFVMELVKGVPITKFADDAGLSLQQRLELFVPVCQAVQHAHMKGVIHRDLKPGNVLVTLHDGVAVPKVIDFGIAKATAARLTEKSVFTEFRQMLGTPEYMAPEQAELSGLDVDTRADIYSLGVLLYELLTGTRPFDLRTLLEVGYAEMLRTIKEVDPPKPSTRVSTLGAQVTDIAKQRHVSARSLSSLMRGDLDWIVMKALEKERGRRYETATALAEDVLRHLRHEPVLAGPPSGAYRLRKYVRRNRLAVAAGTAITASLLAGAIASSLGYLEAKAQAEDARAAWRNADEEKAAAVKARDAEVRQKRAAESAKADAEAARLEEQRQREAADRSAEEARSESRRAHLTADFMAQMLVGVGPRVAQGRDVTLLRELLDDAAWRIRRGDLREVPAGELYLRRAIGSTYREIAAYDAARDMLAPALDLAGEVHGEDHEDVAATENEFGLLCQATGDLSAAEDHYREALAILERQELGDHKVVQAALSNLGSVLQARGRLVEAELLMQRALKMARRVYVPDHASTATALGNLGTLLVDLGRESEAEPLLVGALEMRKRLFAGDHPSVALAMAAVGTLAGRRGEHVREQEFALESLEMFRRLYSGDHPAVSQALVNLGAAFHNGGDAAGAERYLREGVDMQRRLFPAGHPDLVAGLLNLASTRFECANPEGAGDAAEEALSLGRRVLGEDHMLVGRAWMQLGRSQRDRGDRAAAESSMRRALEILQRAMSDGSFVTAECLNHLSGLLFARGEVTEAEKLLAEALEMTQRLGGESAIQRAMTLKGMASIRRSRQDYAGAESLQREALDLYRRHLGEEHRIIAQAMLELGSLLMWQGKLDVAEEQMRAATAMFERLYPSPDHPAHQACRDGLAALYDSYCRLAGIHVANDQFAEAEAFGRKALAAAPPADRDGIRISNAYYLIRLDRLSEAEELLRQPLEMETESTRDNLRALLALCLLLQHRAPEAESLAKESLAWRAQHEAKSWRHYNAMSMLGDALLQQGRLAEAEPLLLEATTCMQPSAPGFHREMALQRVVQLYELQGQAALAAEWRAKLPASGGSKAPDGTPK